MAQTKFDKQVEKDAESLMFGIGRVLAGRDLDGVKRTDATFWRSGTRVLPKVEGRVRRRSYKPGWRRLSFRLALGAGVAETGYLSTRDLDATVQSAQELWDNRDQALAALEPAGIGGACVLTVGTAAYMALTRERRELMREWVGPLHDALHQPRGMAEQTDPRRRRVADELGIDADPKAIGPRLLILLEEINATMKQLARYWEKTRESGDPKVSPAIDALNEILYMGRQLRMQVLLVAQSATARALGGPLAAAGSHHLRL
jgi:hypothetical protein